MSFGVTAAERQFTNCLQQLAFKHSLWTVFQDFLDFTLLMLRWWDVNPAHFADLESRWKMKEEHELFAQAYMAMSEIADHNGEGFYDPFGDYFMEYLSSEAKGQFFTPDHMCTLLTALSIAPQPEQAMADYENGVSEHPEPNPNQRIADCACGSGRILLKAAQHNRHAKFFGADIDITCCKMTVINFMLNSITGEVAWMNSLSNEHWKSWHILKILNPDTGYYLPYYYETGARQNVNPPSPVTANSVNTPDAGQFNHKKSKQWTQQTKKKSTQHQSQLPLFPENFG